MYRKSDENVQVTLDDCMISHTDQERKAVDKSRAKLVGDYVYSHINEEKFSSFYSSDKSSRPNISIQIYVCALILMRMYDLTTQQFIEMLHGGFLSFQYALHTLGWEKQPLSERSLTRFRKYVREYNEAHSCDLLKEEFERISREWAVDLGLLPDPEKEYDSKKEFLLRMDSMMIEAHAKVMPRLEIIYTTNLIMIRWLVEHDFIDAVPESMYHYISDDDRNRTLYYRGNSEKKSDEQNTRVEKVIAEMVLLKKSMQQNFGPLRLSQIDEYQLLSRVLDEQTITKEDGTIVPKNKKDISAASVQNPFDVDVTYRKKRGHHRGSVLNTVEAIDGKGGGLLVGADLQNNRASDADMARKFVDEQPENGPKMRIPVDGGYASEDLLEAAKEKNVDFKVTALTGKAPDDMLADWKTDESGKHLQECPKGNVPEECTFNAKQGYIIAKMPNNCCADCPYHDRCKAKITGRQGKKRSSVKVRVAGIHRAKILRHQHDNPEETSENSHLRNGIEGVMSVMRRKYGLDDIPVFGLNASGAWVWPSLISYNLVKMDKHFKSAEPQIAS